MWQADKYRSEAEEVMQAYEEREQEITELQNQEAGLQEQLAEIQAELDTKNVYQADMEAFINAVVEEGAVDNQIIQELQTELSARNALVDELSQQLEQASSSKPQLVCPRCKLVDVL